MKKRNYYYLLIFALFCFIQTVSISPLLGQASTANYTFAATTNGTMTDMSSGTTTLINPDVDGLNFGTFSITNSIGFTFYFMGSPYTEFVATEDGVIRLGKSLASISRVPAIEVDEPRLIPFSCDMRTGSNGKVHYKVTGTEPNRVFTIEWKNMIVSYTLDSQDGKSTFQLRLYESSNKIEFVYGYMYAETHRSGQEDYGHIGIVNSNVSNGMLYKSGAFNNSTSSTDASSPTAILPTLIDYEDQVINGLSSTADGYRMQYSFTPISAPIAPSNISFSGITETEVTVNWSDNSDNEAYFYVSISEDGGSTYEVVAIENSNITSTTISGLPSKSYWFKVEAVNEGGISASVSASQATTAAGEILSNQSGDWSAGSTWVGGLVPTNTDNVTIDDSHTVTIDNTSAVCNNITIGQGTSGILQFAGGTANATLSCDGDVSVNANATFNIVSGATGGMRKLYIGKRTRANANLTVNGTLNMNGGGSSVADVEFNGSSDGTISGAGATCDFYSITIDKGSDEESIVEVTREITMASPTSADNLLTISNGTFKLSSSSGLEPYYGDQTIMSATGRLWINNSSAVIQCVNTGFSTTGAGDPTIPSGGILQVTAGEFNYGNGDYVCYLNGTLKLESPDAVFNMYGQLNVASTAYLVMTDGAINLDPRSPGEDLVRDVLVFDDESFALITGGTITIVDPPVSDSYDVFVIPSAGEKNKSFIGSTLQLGDGSSTTAGSFYGYKIAVPTQYRLSLGNIKINNPAPGSNRHVSFYKTDANANDFMVQDIIITDGELELDDYSGTAQTFEVYGNVTNDGALDASVSGSGLLMVGSSSQTISGSGTFAGSNYLELEIDNPNGVILSTPFEVYDLILTDGTLATDGTNILTILDGTSLEEGSSSSWVNGPLKRILPGGTNDITFPVGKGSNNMIEMIDAVTTAADVEVIAEVFDADCGGSYSNDPYILSAHRYWRIYIAANGSNFTNSYVQITENSKTDGQYLVYSSTVDGTYDEVSDLASGGNYTIVSNTARDESELGFYTTASDYLSGTCNVGVGETYTSLTGATGSLFVDLNNKGLNGDLTVHITSDLTETGAVALNQWNEANGTGHTMTIVSSAATTRTISGSVKTVASGGQGAMIKLNGTDNLLIDGTKDQYLVFENNTTNAGNTSATIEIYNGSTNVLLDSCVFENHNNSASTQGVITLGAGANTSISISGCDIRNATSGTLNYPYCAIYSDNASNSGITIANNAIYNFGYYGCNFSDVGDDLTITGNSFFKTITDDLSTIDQIAININAGNNHSITGNYIGGQEVQCGGSAWEDNASSAHVKGIVLNVGTANATSVQNNTISNFDVQGTSGTSFVGIEIAGGSVNVGTASGNTISNISSAADAVLGIYSTTANSVVIANNAINTITASNTGSSVLKGIYHAAISGVNINANTIHTLACAGNTSDLTDHTISGIYVTSASNMPAISENTIYNISATASGAVQTNASGIALNSVISANVSRNKIFGIKNASTETTVTSPPTASGIVVSDPDTDASISNNMVSLGNGETTNTGFIGIWLNKNPLSAADIEIYYNSIAVSGTVSSGALPTFGFLRGDNSTTSITNIQPTVTNNIFANMRSGGTGSHFAIGNQGSLASTGWVSSASNYNLLVGGTSSTIAYWNSTVCDFAAWKTNSSGDNNSYGMNASTGVSDATSLNLNNLFTDLSTGDLSVQTGNSECWSMNGKGMPLTAITKDFADNSRSNSILNGVTDLGAFELKPTSTPIPASESGTIGDGNTTTYYYGGRQVGAITWHGSDFPTIQVYYYSGTNPTDDGEGTLASANYANAYWEINASGGDIDNYTYDLTLNYEDVMLQSIADEGAMNLMKNPVIYPLPSSTPDNNWNTYEAISRDGVNNSITVNGIIGFSEFGLEEGMTPLPVEFKSFVLINEGESVRLSWSTASEKNNEYFALEKSDNGVSFIEFARIDGAINSTHLINYSYTDTDPFNGISYYRIRQIDLDGTNKLSETKSIQMGDGLGGDIVLYYNSNADELHIKYVEGNSQKGYLNIFNYEGNLVFKDFLDAAAFDPISLVGLPSGFYVAHVQFEKTYKSITFIK